MEDIFFLGLVGFQWCESLCLETPLDAELVAGVMEFGKVDGYLAGIGIKVASGNKVPDVVGVPLLGKLVIEGLYPKREGVVDADDGLARKEHGAIEPKSFLL
jgi:hypothetical protein